MVPGVGYLCDRSDHSFVWRNVEDLGNMARKVVESYKKGLMGHLSRIMEDSRIEGLWTMEA